MSQDSELAYGKAGQAHQTMAQAKSKAKLKKTSAPGIRRQKNRKKVVMLTAYDTTMASLLDPHVDLLLVGDSLACVLRGESNTLSVTMEEMIYHCKMVVRGAPHPLIVGDMPFGSYQVSAEDALRNAIRLVKEAGVGAIKLEGGQSVCSAIQRIVDAGIPVMGHVGLTPQSYHAMGGHKIQGKGSKSANRILEDAKAVETAGAFAVVLEGIPSELASRITDMLSIPTIGIGAGAGCDGQVLVINDMLGLNSGPVAMKFNKEFVSLRELIHKGVAEFVAEVRNGTFPTTEHSFSKPARKPKKPQTNPDSQLIPLEIRLNRTSAIV